MTDGPSLESPCVPPGRAGARDLRVFWLGWMVFYSFLMVPVLRGRLPKRAEQLAADVQNRMRPLVYGLLSLLVFTGLYNLAHLGYLNVRVFLGPSRGLWMVLKLFLAVLLIVMYLMAPQLRKCTSDV